MTTPKHKKTFVWSPEKFSALRVKRGFTYGKLAAALQEYKPKISKSYIYKWSKGSEPGSSYLFAICAILKVDPWDLSE